MSQNSQRYPVSVFGIIVVGLLSGLTVGLLSPPNATTTGFLLGFAGGALITTGVSLLASRGTAR